MSFRKSRNNNDEDKKSLLLHSMEIDYDNDDNDDYYSQGSSSSNDSYEDDDNNDYAFHSSLYRWTCRSIVVIGLILIPLSWVYSYFDHHHRHRDVVDDDDFISELNSLPYKWEPDDRPYDKCNPGNYFSQIMEKTLSMTDPGCPELCDVAPKVNKTKRFPTFSISTVCCCRHLYVTHKFGYRAIKFYYICRSVNVEIQQYPNQGRIRPRNGMRYLKERRK